MRYLGGAFPNVAVGFLRGLLATNGVRNFRDPAHRPGPGFRGRPARSAGWFDSKTLNSWRVAHRNFSGGSRRPDSGYSFVARRRNRNLLRTACSQ